MQFKNDKGPPDRQRALKAYLTDVSIGCSNPSQDKNPKDQVSTTEHVHLSYTLDYNY